MQKFYIKIISIWISHQNFSHFLSSIFVSSLTHDRSRCFGHSIICHFQTRVFMTLKCWYNTIKTHGQVNNHLVTPTVAHSLFIWIWRQYIIPLLWLWIVYKHNTVHSIFYVMWVTPIPTIYTYKNAHNMFFTRNGYNRRTADIMSRMDKQGRWRRHIIW